MSLFPHRHPAGLRLLARWLRAGLLCGLAARAVAEPLLTDPFTDGSATNPPSAVGADALGGVWFKTSGTLTVVDDAAGIGAGAALQFSGTSSRNLRAFFPAVTLSNADDFLRVRLRVRFGSAPGNLDNALRFGLYTAAGTQQTTDAAGTTDYDDKGYLATANVGTASASKLSAAREAAGDGFLGGVAPGGIVSLATGETAAFGTTPHDLVLEIRRLTNGDLRVTTAIDDLAPAVGVHSAASVLTYAFDELGLAVIGLGSIPVLLDEVKVEVFAHPYMIVKAADFATLQGLAAGAPWSAMKSAALNTSNTMTVNPSEGIRDRAFDLARIMDTTALAYILDTNATNRATYRNRFYQHLKYWDPDEPGNITNGLTTTSWDGYVATGNALFYTVVAMDIFYHAAGATPEQLAQREGFNALMERDDGLLGRVGPGKFFYENTDVYHYSATYAARGAWALWKGDVAMLRTVQTGYKNAWLDFISEDGVFREYGGYGLARSGEPSRWHKTFFGDVLAFTGQEPDWYATPKLQKFQEWLAGYALMPNRWCWPIGDTSYTSYSGNYNSNFDRSDRFSALAATYGMWAKNGATPAGRLFPYVLLNRTPVAAQEAPSRIFPDGGVYMKQPGGGTSALASVLVNQKFAPVQYLGHFHKEQNSLQIAGFGELLLRGSGYNGYGATDPIGGGFTFAYTNNHAVSSNVAMFDYNIGNYLDPSYANDHDRYGYGRSGALGVGGLLGGTLDYATGDTGPWASGFPGTNPVIPNGRHVRHVVTVYPQDGVGGYVQTMDELQGATTATNGHLVWHPHSDTITVNADNSGNTEYEWQIKQTVNTAEQLSLSLYMPTAATGRTQYDGLFGEDISGQQPYRTFVGRYVFLTYPLSTTTKRRNVLSMFFPRKSTGTKPAMTRLTATGPASATAQAAGYAFAGGVNDFALESDGSGEFTVPGSANDPDGAAARGKVAVWRKITAGAETTLAFYFVGKGRAFKNKPTGFTHGFLSAAEVDLHLRGRTGSIVSPGTDVTFYAPGFFEVKIDGVIATALSAGDGFTQVNVPAGTHRIELFTPPDLRLTQFPGSAADGTVTDTIGASTIRFARFVAGSNVTVDKLHARLLAAGSSSVYRAALYADSQDQPGALVQNTTTRLANPATGWHAFTFATPQPLSAGTAYWLAIWSNAASAGIYAQPSDGTVRQFTPTTLGGNGTWPTSFALNATTTAPNPGYTYALCLSPVVQAGANQTITLPTTASLGGTATSDSFGLNPGTIGVTWAKVSGPGTVSFSAAQALATTAGFSLPGSYVLSLAATDGALTGTPAQLTVTALDSFTAWAARTGVGGAAGDFDFDGTLNLLEYGLNTDATSATSAARPVAGREAGTGKLTLTFNRIADAALLYEVFGSSNLADWTPLWSSTGAANTAGPVTVTDNPPVGATQRYLRLKVTTP